MAQVVCIQRGHNTQPLSCFHFCILFPCTQALWPELFFAASLLAFQCCLQSVSFLHTWLDARHVVQAPSLTSMAGAASKQHDAAATTAFVAWVFVLGDFGRSPRMQYHTQSLSSQPSTAAVHVIAYGGAAPMESLRCNPKVHISTLPEVPKLIMRMPGGRLHWLASGHAVPPMRCHQVQGATTVS